ncbi:MAG: translation elongation factor EF-1 subunit alpha [Thermoproteota archaeon]|jgi:elongation factor 1-alpha|nr:translation elongation factor EF-1 subunit alpha [Thermoproteota archaeon]
MSEKKPHLNLIVAGHVDHGKSTTTGHLLYELGVVDQKKLKEIEEEAKKRGKEFAKYAWILDTYKEERERDMTIDLTFLKFETKKYFFTIIDAPGHRDFVKNMVTGASQADAAILVVSAKKGEFEAGIGATGQTREHAFLLRTMGVNQLVIAINKMDDPSVNYSKERYEEVKKGILDLLKQLGYPVDKIRVVPISAWYGDNLIERSKNTPWYTGPTLVEALDEFIIPPRPVDKPLRIPIEAVYSITGVGTVPVGKVESGRLRVGDTVVVMPSGKKGEVRSIETHHTPIQEALPGDNIGFNIKGIAKEDVKRGDVVGHVSNPPTVANSFIARIFVIYHPTSIAVGYTPVMHIHTATVATKFEEIQKKLDIRTGATIEENPKFIKQGDAAIVKLRPIRPVIVEKYSEFPALGRFAIRDMGRTIAAGVVLDVEPAKI